jgi:hypothetical protein
MSDATPQSLGWQLLFLAEYLVSKMVCVMVFSASLSNEWDCGVPYFSTGFLTAYPEFGLFDF